ncbi:Na+/solute symporter [Striga asiatica]|uniref:Na+/solute symporter n=1 Tax=Striga asiatica TaxID=4170 RepID=A0A5A7PGB0_STRAF|nr:Na+/solute symporter [Striga asiatica]
MSHMIRRAASSLTPSRQFWSKVSAFQESENGIAFLGKNLLSLALVFGLSEHIDACNIKGNKQLSGIYDELRLEWVRYFSAMTMLDVLRFVVLNNSLVFVSLLLVFIFVLVFRSYLWQNPSHFGYMNCVDAACAVYKFTISIVSRSRREDNRTVNPRAPNSRSSTSSLHSLAPTAYLHRSSPLSVDRRSLRLYHYSATSHSGFSLPLLLAMSHMIRRAASSLTHSRQFWSMSAFQETENGNTNSILVKNLVRLAVIFGVSEYIDAHNIKGERQLVGIYDELRKERSEAQKAKRGERRL